MTGKRKSMKGALVCDLIGGVLLLAVILCCLPLTLPRLAGYQVFQVISGSMEPAIPTGSLVYVKETVPEDVEPDDVIAFYSGTGSGAVITHRVLQNQVVSGQFITKGDANEREDMNPVDYDEYIGRVEMSLPYLGYILSHVVTLQGRLTAVCLVLLAALLHLAAGWLRRRQDNIK